MPKGKYERTPKVNKAISDGQKKRWAEDPEWADNMRKTYSERLTDLWKTEEFRAAQLAYSASDENVKRLQNMCKGIPKSPETKEKMRQAKLGTTQSPEHLAKRIASIKAYYAKKKMDE